MTECKCGNPKFGFDCVCAWIEGHPGDNEYTCEFCGTYNASTAICNKCEYIGTKDERQVITVMVNNHDTDEDVGIDILIDAEKTDVKRVRQKIAKFLEDVEGVEVQTVFN